MLVDYGGNPKITTPPPEEEIVGGRRTLQWFLPATYGPNKRQRLRVAFALPLSRTCEPYTINWEAGIFRKFNADRVEPFPAQQVGGAGGVWMDWIDWLDDASALW